jgi:hypothetical protein
MEFPKLSLADVQQAQSNNQLSIGNKVTISPDVQRIKAFFASYGGDWIPEFGEVSISNNFNFFHYYYFFFICAHSVPANQVL